MIDAVENAAGKQRQGFKKGQSGNPAGKPKGARNRVTLAAEALLDGEAEALTRKAIEMALGGDGPALRICLERLLPPRRERPLAFDLPKIERAADLVPAFNAIAKALASGDLTPGEASDVARIVQSAGAAIETRDLEARIAALEAKEQKR